MLIVLPKSVAAECLYDSSHALKKCLHTIIAIFNDLRAVRISLTVYAALYFSKYVF